MESNHLSNDDWVAYHHGALSAGELLALTDHLAECSPCAEERDSRFAAGAPTFPPDPEAIDADFEEIAAWVDGTMLDLVDRETFEARLAVDPPLRAEVNDLAAFKAAMGRLPAHEHSPLATPANVIPFSRSTASHWLLPMAAAAAVMLTVLVCNLSQPASSRSALASDELTRAVEAALAGGKLTLPPLPPELRPARGVLAGSGEGEAKLKALHPVGRVVRELRPRLAWHSVAAADAYLVQLLRSETGAVLSSPMLPASARNWQPAQSLVPGAIYEWQVQAMKDGAPIDQAPRPPEPEARFQVLDAAQEARLSAIETAPGHSGLELGMAYAQAGLAADADAQWQTAGPEGQRLRAALKAAGDAP